MFISMCTAFALILQIGAFAVHFHPHTHEHEILSIDNKQADKGHHCDLCDGILQIASPSAIDITIVNTCSILPYCELPPLSSLYHFSERASSRAPPIV